MAGILEFAPAIVLLPFLSFLIALGAGRYMPKGGALAGIGATGGSFALAVATFFSVSGGQTYNQHIYTWATGVGDAVTLDFGLLIDPLSAMMLVIVTLIAFLVHIFSLGYMNDEGETGLPRYYAALGLFSASMLGFVVSNNLLMAFMFFELVGLCSYLLIGFWFRQDGPPSAAKKAFLVTRFGDYFFLIGVVAVFATFGSAAFAGPEAFPVLAEEALHGEHAVNTFLGMGEQAWFTVVGLLVLGGVVGKSAQFPLHTWLPDAMEGPTPVSALIHAATMVAAGVYLVARMYGFYALTPTTLAIIALIGGFTALFAATMGLVKREIKQVLAYSTISQYGYMMLGLGAGGYVAATFHLMTHAFFKALLFLGAGSVIIAMHHNEDMWDMGGLKDKMPVTYYTFLSGSLALAGIVPFAGFWSKDEVLYEALNHGLGTEGGLGTILLAAYAMGLLAVFFTGFYTFRMVFLTFHGKPRTETARDPHGVRWNVKLPLIVLGTLAAVAGLVNMAPVEELTGMHLAFLHDWLDHGFGSLTAHHYLEVLESGVGAGIHPAGIGSLGPGALSLGLALAGAGVAYRLYNVPEPVEHTDKLGGIKTTLYNNYYQDEYQVWIATGVVQPISRVLDKFDQGIVDGVVNGISSVSLFAGGRVKRLQTGVVSNYAALLTLGLTALLLGLGLIGGWFA
ncbi:NADH-quinone oxidoreductase subunit L [Haloferax mediterranei ATCC 33500]|uniref:NADH dehydrogenase, subunit L (Ubiquinone) n=1 Tax=Haloferax mediterranei (strain ATCC 33500 / DSM 1411 / JCM 8866 / NBRC 14739 / NCIMB 2177 / R-4) TaxID=523841 RepID=I3R392_HALMT|nr:NADH-quinone oxidoreductase subunit L [Haloferax mediterranei]AFK18702.1 NADH dehydrogenase, subunit L (ubiquinone) [Haloferax mediterranei ATCC 33500]AHZ21928.1 oxidoreductase [Haloferax mediterranei ATCC 33500]EMA03437.1 NADH dehydrogenase, subunit L (ubiquinone) [Haloferax mediterranei ATCC 33500]MDX5988799.1 NADH-quinone oxidoreductase subunit L [Haloferax mediterranei ATCC 33500]QCQ75202.1 NADH-quinone oxidoreductase subunit L [Haloferax mediterranei ATCC 33500]